MRRIKSAFFLLAVFGVLMAGCYKETTVILPPEALPGTSAVTTQPSSVPTTTPTTVPATVPTTVPTTEPTVTPATAPTTVPTTAPTTAPTTVPTTAPTTAPTTSPTTAPTTEPATNPVTEPSEEPTTEPDVYDISGHIIGSLEWEILEELNARRTSESQPDLTMDSTLSALAAIRAYECTQELSSVRPDGRSWDSVLSDYSFADWSFVGEIRIYGSQSLPASIWADTWISADSSRNSILSANFRYCGIGLAYSGTNIYIVTIFAG